MNAPPTCEYCGTAIDTDEWHPVVADERGDDFELLMFCSDSCQHDWELRQESSTEN